MSHRKTIRKSIRTTMTIPYMVAGVGPESLTFDPEAAQTEISLICYDGERLLEEHRVEITRVVSQLEKWPVVWINVEGLASDKKIKWLGDLFKIHPLALEDIVTVHQRAKFETYDDCCFFIAHMMEAKDELKQEQVSLYFNSKFVITFQEGPIDATKPVLERIRKGQGRMRSAGADYLAYAIIDSVIDCYYPILEYFGEKLENMEDEILDAPSKRTVTKLHSIKRELLAMRRALFPLREALSSMLRNSPDYFTADTLLHLRDSHDHVVQIADFIDTYRELCSDLMDVYLSTTSNRLSEVMKVLTVITTVCAPPTLVAGIYGMNFNPESSPYNMPELNWFYGYPIAIVLMVSLSAALFMFILKPLKRLESGDTPKAAASNTPTASHQ
ncbi:MAG: magnesium/cobalt transporter CorA [Candidatus Obscuribacterales bacterium]|nr:magnesium/cobalt transporter CorA [Candidatus Obscuribacterales bacterium]